MERRGLEDTRALADEVRADESGASPSGSTKGPQTPAKTKAPRLGIKSGLKA